MQLGQKLRSLQETRQGSPPGSRGSARARSASREFRSQGSGAECGARVPGPRAARKVFRCARTASCRTVASEVAATGGPQGQASSHRVGPVFTGFTEGPLGCESRFETPRAATSCARRGGGSTPGAPRQGFHNRGGHARGRGWGTRLVEGLPGRRRPRSASSLPGETTERAASLQPLRAASRRSPVRASARVSSSWVGGAAKAHVGQPGEELPLLGAARHGLLQNRQCFRVLARLHEERRPAKVLLRRQERRDVHGPSGKARLEVVGAPARVAERSPPGPSPPRACTRRWWR